MLLNLGSRRQSDVRVASVIVVVVSETFADHRQEVSGP